MNSTEVNKILKGSMVLTVLLVFVYLIFPSINELYIGIIALYLAAALSIVNILLLTVRDRKRKQEEVK